MSGRPKGQAAFANRPLDEDLPGLKRHPLTTVPACRVEPSRHLGRGLSTAYDPAVPSASDYLDLAAAQARSQWRSVLARQPRPDTPGFRQVAFTPVETLFCLAAMAVVDHHHYGGSTNHLAPSPVTEPATLFQRTRASLLAKQANLDGSRANGARHEVDTA